jgi:hypothetical protein
MIPNEKKVQQALQFLRHDALQLLNNLHEDTQPVWGRMTPQHMLEHLMWALDGSSSSSQLKVAQSPTLQKMRPLIRGYVLSSIRLPKNISLSKTKKDLLPLKNESFEAAKKKLQISITNALEVFLNNQQFQNNHPFAGPFNSKQWIIFHRKHFIHHFTQFGLLPQKMFV